MGKFIRKLTPLSVIYVELSTVRIVEMNNDKVKKPSHSGSLFRQKLSVPFILVSHLASQSCHKKIGEQVYSNEGLLG